MGISIKKVLSIDIDYVMSPTIQLYNELYETIEKGGNDPMKMSYKDYWDKVEELTESRRFLEYDQAKYDAVKDLCLKVAEYLPPENIYFAREHDAILTFLCQDKKKVDYIYDIYNVDHHHDIYYNDSQKAWVHRFNFAQCANWVWYLYENKKLNQYFWIRNENSKRYPFVGNNGCNKDLACPEFYSMSNIKEVKELESRTFDYMFLCRSNNYLPFKFESLFNNLRDSIGKLKKTKFPMDMDLYCGEEGKTRFPIK